MKMEVTERGVRRRAEWRPASGIRRWNRDKISPHMSTCQIRGVQRSVRDESFPARNATGCGRGLLLYAYPNTPRAGVRCVHGQRRAVWQSVHNWNTAVSFTRAHAENEGAA